MCGYGYGEEGSGWYECDHDDCEERCGGLSDVEDYARRTGLGIDGLTEYWDMEKKRFVTRTKYAYELGKGHMFMNERVETVSLDELIEKKRAKLVKTQDQLDELLEQKKLTEVSKRAQKLADLVDGAVIKFVKQFAPNGARYTYAALKTRGRAVSTSYDKWYLTQSSTQHKGPFDNDQMAEFIGDVAIHYVSHWDWNQL